MTGKGPEAEAQVVPEQGAGVTDGDRTRMVDRSFIDAESALVRGLRASDPELAKLIASNLSGRARELAASGEGDRAVNDQRAVEVLTDPSVVDAILERVRGAARDVADAAMERAGVLQSRPGDGPGTD